MAFRSLLKIPKQLVQQNTFNRSICIVPLKSGRFRSSERFTNIELHPDVQKIENPPEWKYVEELLGVKTIPNPQPKNEYPSGWTPQITEKFDQLPYYVKRSKNHLLPVYLKLRHRNMQRLTFIKNIEGDIFAAEKDFVAFIRTRIGNVPVYTQINELGGSVTIKGDYVTLIQKFLYQKGL